MYDNVATHVSNKVGLEKLPSEYRKILLNQSHYIDQLQKRIFASFHEKKQFLDVFLPR